MKKYRIFKAISIMLRYCGEAAVGLAGRGKGTGLLLVLALGLGRGLSEGF